MKIYNSNRKAFHEYTILDTIEVGIVLNGSEVKSIKNSLIRLTGSYGIVNNGELKLLNCHITKYKFAYQNSCCDETRTRILLVNKSELRKLTIQVSTKGITLIPLKIYSNKKGCIKLEIGIAKHKKLWDKRNELREKDLDKEAKRELKEKF